VTEKALATRLIHTRLERLSRKTVNPPVEHASTLLVDDPDDLYGETPTYARMGLTAQRELEAGLCELEGGAAARLTPNGLSACALAVASVVDAGDHVLIADTIYGPTRRFCERRLRRMGVRVTRFPPRIGSDIETLVEETTRAVVLESPGSLTFEVMDVPAITAVARERGLTTIMDNTWSAGVACRPLELGVDLSVQALTKYVVGHSDAFGGAVMSRTPDLAARVDACAEEWGLALGPDDAYLALRGLRTLPMRYGAHDAAARRVAEWLATRREVAEVLHPALPGHPDHAIWQRDFTGACGLFGIVLAPQPEGAVDAFLRALDLFGMGFSWGGFESLILPCDPQLRRLPGDWSETKAGPLLRLHIGLENPDDLMADLEHAMANLQPPNPAQP